MFIPVLAIIYSCLVGFLLIMYLTKQRKTLINWAKKHGHINNFFIRVLRGNPKQKRNKSSISKAMLDHHRD